MQADNRAGDPDTAITVAKLTSRLAQEATIGV